MRKYIVLLILAALCLIPQPTAAQGGEESWLLNQVNALRAQNGRGALSWNSQLTAAALAHSQVLATTPWVGPHIEANGSTPQSRAAAQGYGGSVGENVVGGGTATLEWAWNWWMNSAVHVSNMLGNWNEVGIAVANGSTGRFYTMVFGNNGGAAPPPPPPPASDDAGASNAGSSGGAQQVVSVRDQHARHHRLLRRPLPSHHRSPLHRVLRTPECLPSRRLVLPRRQSSWN
ncbi:MAG: CAP domain-containing protein [Anaerolineae bacterium]